MRAPHRRLATALALAGALACGEKGAAPAPASSAPPPAAQPDPAAAATAADRPAMSAAPAAPAKPAPAPAPTMKPAPAPPAPVAKPAPAPPPAAKPAPEPPAAPAAGAHARVGPDKCRMCHRVQHQSWAESAHAKKGLDCEGCHGNGGDYWPASVMRDRAKAAAAGLVQPGVDRCRACHPKADAALLPRAHAHKAR